MEYAGRRRRFFGFVIDLIVVLILVGILNAVGLIDTFASEEGEVVSTVDGLVQAGVGFGYYFVLTALMGATLGKMALGMKVVGADGNKARPGAVLVRELIARALGAILSAVIGAAIGGIIGVAVAIIIIIMILFDDKRQGLHDKIGGTFVVRA